MSARLADTLDGRRALCARACRLNGQLAVITSARLPYAVVRSLECHALSVPYSWAAVEQITDAGEDFRA